MEEARDNMRKWRDGWEALRQEEGLELKRVCKLEKDKVVSRLEKAGTGSH